MSRTSAESARRPSSKKKIEFSCSCGKRYRVPASRAGKKVRCRDCNTKVTIPGDANISLRTRKAILDELGIDPEAAEQAYTTEQQTSYVCTLCATKLAEEELQAAYGEEGLVCSSCRAAAVEQRGDTPEEKKKKQKKLEKWSNDGRTVEGAKLKAYAYGLLFFAGIAGFVHTFFAPMLIVSLAVGAVIAAAGGRAIFKAYEPVPAEEPKKR